MRKELLRQIYTAAVQVIKTSKRLLTSKSKNTHNSSKSHTRSCTILRKILTEVNNSTGNNVKQYFRLKYYAAESFQLLQDKQRNPLPFCRLCYYSLSVKIRPKFVNHKDESLRFR